jgi:formate/nitrite transporter FocA (FNT family)
MLIKPRRVRHSSKFTSRMQTGARQRREYAASAYSMAAIKAMLAVAMITAGIRAYQAIEAQSSASLPLKLALPVVFIAGALLVLRSCVKNIREVREISQFRRSSRDR